MTVRIINADVMVGLSQIADESVNCVVTSPPYWGLRDYGTDGQIGLEATPADFVSRLVGVFRDVRRVLRKDGTCWVNLGDSYNAAGRVGHGTRQGFKQGTNRASANGHDECRPNAPGLKPKDL
jgi:DNA modification methylase